VEDKRDEGVAGMNKLMVEEVAGKERGKSMNAMKVSSEKS